MEYTVELLFRAILKLAMVSGAALYAVLVLASYSAEGPGCKLSLDRKDPARSLERLFVWLGVKFVAALVRFGRKTVDFLSEPSADLGEWLLARSPFVRDSRFRFPSR